MDVLLKRGQSNPPNILLALVTNSLYLFYREPLKQRGIEISPSNFIGFLEMSSILSKIKVESRPLFQCFRCFDHNIWTLILISIISISILSSLRQKPFKSIYEYFWNYSISFFGISFQNFINVSGINLSLMICAWILSAFILIIEFNAYFLDEMVSPTPLTKIDSLDELFKSNMVIFARDDSTFLGYLKSINSTWKNHVIDDKDFLLIQDTLFEGLRNGTLAHVNHKYIIIYIILFNMKEYYKNNLEIYNKIIDQLYISKEDGGSEPYYINLFKVDKDIENDLTIT